MGIVQTRKVKKIKRMILQCEGFGAKTMDSLSDPQGQSVSFSSENPAGSGMLAAPFETLFHHPSLGGVTQFFPLKKEPLMRSAPDGAHSDKKKTLADFQDRSHPQMTAR